MEFVVGMDVAVHDIEGGLRAKAPPIRGRVTAVNKRFVAVQVRSNEYKFQPDGRHEFPRSRERFQTRFPKIDEWTPEKKLARMHYVRRRSVVGFKYADLTDEQISRVYELLGEFGQEPTE